MIRQPDELSGDLLAEVAADAARKRDLAALAAVRLETFTEGLAAQILHVGPYADEAPTIERLHAFLTEQGLHLDGKHHEIYLAIRAARRPSGCGRSSGSPRPERRRQRPVSRDGAVNDAR